MNENIYKVICCTDEYHASIYKARGFNREGRATLADNLTREEAEKELLNIIASELNIPATKEDAKEYMEEHEGESDAALNFNKDGEIEGFHRDIFDWYIYREPTAEELAERDRRADEARAEMQKVQKERAKVIEHIREVVGTSVADVIEMYKAADKATEDIAKGDKRRKRRKAIFTKSFSDKYNIEASLTDVVDAFKSEFHGIGIF